MRITGQHILVALIAAVALFSSCGKDEAEIIPRKKLAKIYAEMLVTDQWITATPGVRRIADTSLVYEPILEKYGYDTEDYLKSVDFYMDDPERFSRILRTSGEILEEQIAELKIEKARLDAMDLLPKIEVEFNVSDFFPYMADEPYVHYFDSLDVVLDTISQMYQLVSIERGDTLYDGLRMVFADSLALEDSLAHVADSLALADSLAAESMDVDSLKVDLSKSRPLKAVTLKKDVPEETDRTKRKNIRMPGKLDLK